jgi:large subunit ribosomal protein L3
MNVTGLIGIKLDQKQTFLEDGSRIPVSLISIHENVITQIKTSEKDGYSALQIGFGTHKKAAKPVAGIAKKAGLTETPRFFREIHIDDAEGAAIGDAIKVAEVFEPGDEIKVTGTSKGKGFAGVVKRHGFHGGPKTHGQSDRHRAPGAIGQGTTPGRVYKGKKMAGHMGHEQVTVQNLVIMDIVDGVLVVKGLVPGFKGALVEITKTGTKKKFVPLFKKVSAETETIESIDEVIAATEEAINEAPATEEIATETVKSADAEAMADVPEDIAENAAETVEAAAQVEETEVIAPEVSEEKGEEK